MDHGHAGEITTLLKPIGHIEKGHREKERKNGKDSLVHPPQNPAHRYLRCVLTARITQLSPTSP